MNFERTIKKKMLSLKLQEKYPEEWLYDLQQDFKEMYVAGWEQGHVETHQTTSRMIGQYTREGHLINTFPSIMQATKRTGYHKNTIRHHLNNSLIKPEYIPRAGHIWKYIDVKKEDKLKNQNALF